MWKWGPPLDGIIQIAFVVDDIHAAMPRYASELRVGPWFLAEHFALEKFSYRGAPATPDISLCLGFSGSMMIELIQQNCTSPSPYIDEANRPRCGFHHWGVAATPDAYQDRLDEFVDKGFPMVLDAVVGAGSRASYVDSASVLGGLIELMEINPPVEELFTHMRNSATAGYPAGTILPFPGAPGAQMSTPSEI
ncbi:VOC family protein [Paraburkholderia sp.]|uniref:VOC family protein n=1 Tax=Paraburkholderia sp. TaxID=1926495 RepID=UPI003C7BE31C